MELTPGLRAEVEIVVGEAATPVGGRVTVTAELRDVDGTRLAFACEAVDERDAVVGEGRVERVVVERERFLSRFSR